MKSHINLMAPEVLFDEKPFSIGQNILPLLAAVAAVFLVLFSGVYVLRAQGLKKDVNKLAIQRDQLHLKTNQLNRQIQLLARQTGVSQPTPAQQIAAVKGLLENRIRWSDLIREVSRLVPAGVWLNRIESSDARSISDPLGMNEKKMLFVGIARSQEGVNGLIAGLEQSPRYETVSLNFAEEKTVQGRVFLGFEITAEFGH